MRNSANDGAPDFDVFDGFWSNGVRIVFQYGHVCKLANFKGPNQMVHVKLIRGVNGCGMKGAIHADLLVLAQDLSTRCQAIDSAPHGVQVARGSDRRICMERI